MRNVEVVGKLNLNQDQIKTAIEAEGVPVGEEFAILQTVVLVGRRNNDQIVIDRILANAI